MTLERDILATGLSKDQISTLTDWSIGFISANDCYKYANRQKLYTMGSVGPKTETYQALNETLNAIGWMKLWTDLRLDDLSDDSIATFCTSILARASTVILFVPQNVRSRSKNTYREICWFVENKNRIRNLVTAVGFREEN